MSFIVSILRLVFCDRLFDREKRSKVIANGVLMLTIWCAALYFAVNELMAPNPDSYDTTAVLPNVLLIIAMFVLIILIFKTFFGYAVWPLLKVVPSNSYTIDLRRTIDRIVRDYTLTEKLVWRWCWNRKWKIIKISEEIFLGENMKFPTVRIYPVDGNLQVSNISFTIELCFKDEFNKETIQEAVTYFGSANPKEWTLSNDFKAVIYDVAKRAQKPSNNLDQYFNPLDKSQQITFSMFVYSVMGRLGCPPLIQFKDAKFFLN